jgi:hypothetical protein
VSDARDAFANIARDLVSLEINTVLKDGMSARKMPSTANALIDLAQEYHVYLCEQARLFADIGDVLPTWAQLLSDSFDAGAEPFPRSPGERTPFTPQRELTNELGPAPGIPWTLPEYLRDYPRQVEHLDFKRLREIASWLREMRDRTRTLQRHGGFWPELKLSGQPPPLNPEELERVARTTRRFDREADSILFRIQRTCDLLADMPPFENGAATLRRDSGARLQGQDELVLRKAWDIGTETVVMQTVLQIDGDTITRLQPGRDDAAHATVHQVHNAAVQVSLRHWRTLADTVMNMAETAFSGLFSYRKT